MPSNSGHYFKPVQKSSKDMKLHRACHMQVSTCQGNGARASPTNEGIDVPGRLQAVLLSLSQGQALLLSKGLGQLRQQLHQGLLRWQGLCSIDPCMAAGGLPDGEDQWRATRLKHSAAA